MIWLHFLLHHWLTGVSEAFVSAAKGAIGKCKCSQQGGEDAEQDKMLTVPWGGDGRGNSPKGITKELPVSPGNKPEAHTLCSWCLPRMTGWSPFNTQWTESRPEGQLGIRKHLEDRPGNWKMGHIAQCKPPQSKGVRQGLCWDSFKVRTCPHSRPQPSC